MEADLIAHLRQRIPKHPRLRLGLGDDAAVLDLAGTAECVLTVDMLMDGVDFDLAAIDPRRAGRKALAVNLSDLAAMASRPLAGVVALALPRSPRAAVPSTLDLALQLYEGLLPLAEQYDLVIAGGDTNSWDGPLAVSVTLLGQVTARGPLRRGGARPGDRILVTGSFGGSILGRHLDFEPRVREALLLADRYALEGGMDVSDGLTLDLSRMAEESGCGAVIDLPSVPVSKAAWALAAQQSDGRTPLDHALGDGEDFELILAVAPQEAAKILAEQPLEVPVTDIGQFIAEPGLWQHSAGARRPLAPRGYQHDFA